MRVSLDFNFHITNFPFLSSNIPSSPAYGMFISQLIQYARACSLLLFHSVGQATFLWATQSRIPRGTLEIVIQEVLWSIWEFFAVMWSLPLTNVKWHADPWPTVTSQPIRLSINFMTLIPSLTFTELWVVSMEHLQRVLHASRERLPFRTPGSVTLFGTCLYSNCCDQIPQTCHVFTRLFTLNTLCTFSILLLRHVWL